MDRHARLAGPRTALHRMAIVVSAAMLAFGLVQPMGASAQPGGDCSTSVYFLGARGSDEPLAAGKPWDDPANLGGPVRKFYDQFETAVGGDRIKVVPTIYPAREMEALKLRTGLLRSEFENSMDAGVETVIRDLRSVVSRIEKSGCGGAQIVLSGFSQGAMVMHRALLQLVNEDSELSRAVFKHLTAAYLIADGHRVPHDNTINEGTASSGHGGILPLNQRFPSWLYGRIFSMCDYLDPICSINPQTLQLIAAAPVNWVKQSISSWFGNEIPSANPMEAHFHYGERARSGFSARTIIQNVRAGVTVADRESERARKRYTFTPDRPTGIVIALPDGTTCRDFPGTFNDYNAGEGCSALDTARATLISNGVIAWPEGNTPAIDFGAYASGGSTAHLTLTEDSGGGISASGQSTIVASAINNSLVAAEATGRSTISAIVVDGSFAGAIASDGSVVTLDVSGDSFGGATAESGSRVDATVQDGSLLSVGALGLSILDATLTGGSQFSGSALDGSTMSVALDRSQAAATLGGGGTLDVTASEQSTLIFSAEGGQSSVNLDGQSYAEIASVGGVGVTLDASGKSFALVRNYGGSASVILGDSSVAEVESTHAAADVKAEGSSYVNVEVAGAPSSTVVPVFRAVATDSGRVTGYLSSAHGGVVDATASGAESRVSVYAYELVGTITIVAAEGGYAFFYSDESFTHFGCAGKTSVMTPYGSCIGDGVTSTYYHADGSIDHRDESLYRPEGRQTAWSTSSIDDSRSFPRPEVGEALPVVVNGESDVPKAATSPRPPAVEAAIPAAEAGESTDPGLDGKNASVEEMRSTDASTESEPDPEQSRVPKNDSAADRAPDDERPAEVENNAEPTSAPESASSHVGAREG